MALLIAAGIGGCPAALLRLRSPLRPQVLPTPFEISTSSTGTATSTSYFTPNNPTDNSSLFIINNRTLNYKIRCYQNISDSMSFNNPQIIKLGQFPQECIKTCAALNYAIAAAFAGEGRGTVQGSMQWLRVFLPEQGEPIN
ncbi:uncharacterized protein ATNIH1004_002195 [Aspergillus tanneri]|uniref:Uncharacterized protein n=1 Tax=Aspergillus tanneri TaxID=1220188 RepID=A0A5M9MVW4_9EURO|nr:uncharacterized protein ATNIH1004_002195 [Aspergillus tanneri]KAA8649524.1 hypothetical protein ATNIH1004_002195 [Aspergillus tanneri]